MQNFSDLVQGKHF